MRWSLLCLVLSLSCTGGSPPGDTPAGEHKQPLASAAAVQRAKLLGMAKLNAGTHQRLPGGRSALRTHRSR
jgi:hypothetical protein